MYLFFDTETTGFVRKSLPKDDPLQARVVELAAILVDKEGKELDRLHSIIQPDGWTVPDRVAQIHGITTERARVEGRPRLDVLREFEIMSNKAWWFISHNFAFDNDMMEIEQEFGGFVWIPGRVWCTMKEMTNICKIPNEKRGGYKWPKLQECHKFLFGEEFEGAHGAMADTLACKRIFFECLRLGHITVPEITPQKNPVSE